MRDERGIGVHPAVVAAALLAVVATLTAAPARAQYGFLQLQYQTLRGEGKVLRPDSTYADTSFTLSSWIQHYQFNQMVKLSPVLDLTYQVGYQDQRYIDRTQRTQVPYGRLQLVHPIFGVTAQVRPVWSTSPVSFAGSNIVGADSGAIRQETQQSTQSILSAYVGGPRTPRLEGSWIRNQRQAGSFNAKGASDQRDLRLSQATGPWTWYAGYGDLANATGSYATKVYQRNYRAGAAVTTDPWRNASLTLNYDWTGIDYLRGTGRRDHTYLHRLGANGSYRQSTVLDWNLSSYYSITQLHNGRSESFDNLEGSLFANYHPNRTLNVSAGGGLRKVYLGLDSGFERYLSAGLNMVGRVRPGWDGVLSLNETAFWNPLRDPYHVTTGRVGSNFILRQGVWVNVDMSASVNTDTILAARTSRTANASLNLRPLSSFQLNLSGSDSRSGRDFGSTSTSATTGDIRVIWAVLQSLEFSGSLRGQRLGPGDLGKTTSKSAYVRWLPTRMTQVMFTYDRSDYRYNAPGGLASSLQKRESMSLQGIWNLDRSKQLSAEGGLIDPGTDREAQTLNATFTWRFGR